jgi:alanine racemase
MVRPGTLLYGQYPSKWVSRSLELKPTWHFKTRFVLVKSVPRKWTISYGSEFKTKRPSRVGVIPVGYASGFSVEPASALLNLRGIRNSLLRMMKRYRVRVRIGEHSAPIIGRIAAQSCVIDLTDLPNIQIGDEVTLPARRVMVPSEILRVYTY